MLALVGIDNLGAYQLFAISEVGSMIPTEAVTNVIGTEYQIIKSSKIKDIYSARLNATTPYMFTADEMARFNQLKNRVKLCAWGGDAYAYAMLACGYIDLIMSHNYNTTMWRLWLQL